MSEADWIVYIIGMILFLVISLPIAFVHRSLEGPNKVSKYAAIAALSSPVWPLVFPFMFFLFVWKLVQIANE